MANRKLAFFGQMSSATGDECVKVSVIGMDYIAVHCYSEGGSWDALLVVTPEISLDGQKWSQAVYIDTADGTETNVPTWTANKLRRFIPVFDIPWFQVRVSTVGGATTIKVYIYGQGEHSPLDQRNAQDPVFGNPGISQAGGQRPGGGSLAGGGLPPGASFPSGGIVS